VDFDSGAFLAVSTAEACSAAAEREIAAAARLVAKVGEGADFSGVAEAAGVVADGLAGATAGELTGAETGELAGASPGRAGSFIVGSPASGLGLDAGGMVAAGLAGARRKGGADGAAARAAGDEGGVGDAVITGALDLFGGVTVEAAGAVFTGG